jgi:hypothetical protein
MASLISQSVEKNKRKLCGDKEVHTCKDAFADDFSSQ